MMRTARAGMMLGVLLLSAACADDGDGGAEEGRAAVTTAPVAPTAGSSPSETPPTMSSEEVAAPATASDGDASDVTEIELASPAFGGVRFVSDADDQTVSSNDTVIVFPAGDGSDAPNGLRPEASVGLITQSEDGDAVATASEVLDLIGEVGDATVTPLGDTLDVLGFRLDGFEISRETTSEEPMVFSGNRFPAPVESAHAPFPYARWYLGDTAAGVLLAAVEGADAATADLAEPALARLLATLEFTGAGLDAPLPPGEPIAPEAVSNPPRPATTVDDGPARLLGAFQPVRPDTYQLTNLGVPMTIDVPDDWAVQPNSPGIVVFSARNSTGPGDRDLQLFTDVVEIVAVGSGPHPIGDPDLVGEIEDLLDGPPDGMVFSGVTDVDLGGRSAVRFDATSDPGAACTDQEPCEFALVTTYGHVMQIRSGYDHRIWWIDNPGGAPIVVAASAPHRATFTERASELAESIRMLPSS